MEGLRSTWRRLDKRPLTAALMLVGLIALAIPTGLQALSNELGNYEGAIPGDPNSQVKIRIDQELGKGPNDGELSVDMTQSCSDGTKDVGAASIPLGAATKRRFRGFDEEFGDNGDYSLQKAKIRVFKSGLARGWVYNRDDRKDPPDTGYPDLPDCSTGGRVHWRARAVD